MLIRKINNYLHLAEVLFFLFLYMLLFFVIIHVHFVAYVYVFVVLFIALLFWHCVITINLQFSRGIYLSGT